MKIQAYSVWACLLSVREEMVQAVTSWSHCIAHGPQMVSGNMWNVLSWAVSSYSILLKSMCYGTGSCDSVVGIQQWFPKCALWMSKGSATSSQTICGTFLWWLLWSLLIYLINGIRFCYKWLWSFFNWHCVYFVWPLEQIIKKPPVPTKWATVSLIMVKSCSAFYLRYW